MKRAPWCTKGSRRSWRITGSFSTTPAGDEIDRQDLADNIKRIQDDVRRNATYTNLHERVSGPVLAMTTPPVTIGTVIAPTTGTVVAPIPHVTVSGDHMPHVYADDAEDSEAEEAADTLDASSNRP